MNSYISRERESELITINEFYTRLKAKMTGQVINGTLTGCLLESELEEVYEQFKQSEVDENAAQCDQSDT